MGLAQPRRGRADDPCDAPRERRRDGREAGGALNHEHVDPPELEPRRRYPSTIGGALYLLVLIATAVGIGIVWRGHDWRLGIRVVSGALATAALLRLVLPQRDAGMLAVRPRLVDVFMLGSVAVVLLVLAINIPDQPS